MAKFELSPGRGSLTSVREKKNPKGPDYKGTLKLEDGTELKLAAWIKDYTWGQAISLSIDNFKKASYPQEAQRRDGGDVPF